MDLALMAVLRLARMPCSGIVVWMCIVALVLNFTEDLTLFRALYGGARLWGASPLMWCSRRRALAEQLLGQLWAGSVEADAAPAVRGGGLDDPDGLWVGA